MFDHFVKLAFKGLNVKLRNLKIILTRIMIVIIIILVMVVIITILIYNENHVRHVNITQEIQCSYLGIVLSKTLMVTS